MPLTIPLPAGAKVIINGAVIQNSGYANISLTVHNKANILRDKDVLTQPEANTPAKEIYHAIQNAYLFEANRHEWLAVAAVLMEQFEGLMPAAKDILDLTRSQLGVYDRKRSDPTQGVIGALEPLNRSFMVAEKVCR